MQKENYAERFNDIVILQLNTEGFDKLSEKQKKLAYYLSKAGLCGRCISLEQGSQYNVPLITSLIELYEKVDKKYLLNKQIHDTLFILFTHNGIYHNMSGEKLNLPLELSTLDAYKDAPDLTEKVKKIWFESDIPQFRTVQTEGVDVVEASGGNFYNNVTAQEVNQYRKEKYSVFEGDEVPPLGFNERLSKNESGEIVSEVISEYGLYGKYVQEIIVNLNEALQFSENDKQYKSISTLINFYKSGNPVDFDKHCVAWTEDKDSDIYFINGLIESYDDPMSIGCTFESIVAFKNPIQTAKVNKIINNIQWFENNLPFDKEFKKDKAVGLSASSVSVISMAGETSPSIPLGINLPNSDWIRKKHGSKSVNLSNVAASRSSYEVALREALYLEKYHSSLEKYGNMTSDLHTDLHEIAGHGSGKVLDGVNAEVLGAYYSVIEECRADLVALYYMSDKNLKDFGVYDNNVNVEEAALAQYVLYLTNGAFGQLRRVQLGNDLTQAHFRNRQLISLWVLENADQSKVNIIEEDGKHYIQVNDVNHVKELFGQLLGKIQKIKSTGDFESGKDLVMTYGTKVNIDLHSEVIERMSKLDMPKVVGFITPMLTEKDNDIILEQSNDFFKQQILLHKEYGQYDVTKKKKLLM